MEVSGIQGATLSQRALPLPPTGLPVGGYATYAEAQRAVDFLSDEKFPVEGVTIAGNEMQRVGGGTGRPSGGRGGGGGGRAGGRGADRRRPGRPVACGAACWWACCPACSPIMGPTGSPSSS